MSLIHTNVDGFIKKLELMDLINERKLDIVCLVETKLSAENSFRVE